MADIFEIVKKEHMALLNELAKTIMPTPALRDRIEKFIARVGEAHQEINEEIATENPKGAALKDLQQKRSMLSKWMRDWETQLERAKK